MSKPVEEQVRLLQGTVRSVDFKLEMSRGSEILANRLWLTWEIVQWDDRDSKRIIKRLRLKLEKDQIYLWLIRKGESTWQSQKEPSRRIQLSMDPQSPGGFGLEGTKDQQLGGRVRQPPNHMKTHGPTITISSFSIMISTAYSPI